MFHLGRLLVGVTKDQWPPTVRYNRIHVHKDHVDSPARLRNYVGEFSRLGYWLVTHPELDGRYRVRHTRANGRIIEGWIDSKHLEDEKLFRVIM